MILEVKYNISIPASSLARQQIQSQVLKNFYLPPPPLPCFSSVSHSVVSLELEIESPAVQTSCGTYVTNCGFGQLVARRFWYIRKIRHLPFLVSILPASISIFNYLKWRQRKGTTKLQNRSSYQNKYLLIFSTRFIWLHFCFRCRRVTKEAP